MQWLKKISNETINEALHALYMRRPEFREMAADEKEANYDGYWTKRLAEVEAAIKELESLK
jgi:hypothetical protein